MAPSHGFAAASHGEAAFRGSPASQARPRSEAQRGSVRPAAAMRSTHREMRCSAAVQAARYRARGAPPCGPPIAKSGRAKRDITIPQPCCRRTRRNRNSTTLSSDRCVLLASHRQPADSGNGFDRAVWPDPVSHDDGEQQQTDRDRERQRPTAGAVEDPSEGDR